MRALTLHRPWSYAVAHLGKDIENRNYKCPLSVGTAFAIHSGRAWDEEGASWIEGQGMVLPPSLDIKPKQIIAVCTFAGTVTDSDSLWFRGVYGWKLENIFILPDPVPCIGNQGLWSIPVGKLTDISRQLQGVFPDSYKVIVNRINL